MDKSKVASFLKQLRTEKHYTQEKLVDELNKFTNYSDDFVSPITISKWERGDICPNINHIITLAKFYKVSCDEIFNGERKHTIDFSKKYFTSDPKWFTKQPDNTPLFEIRLNEEIQIQENFLQLLMALIKNEISTNDELELDFLYNHFYKISEYGRAKLNIATDDDDPNADVVKFYIRKETALMHNCSPDEKLWETYKLFDYINRINFTKNLSDIVDNKDALIKQLTHCENWEKDILLALMQRYNITHVYGELNPELNIFFKRFGYEYNPEQLTKDTIKILIQTGACLNDSLLGYQKEEDYQINILNQLIDNHKKYLKPLLIPVFDGQFYHYYTVENTPENRELAYINYEGAGLSDSEITELEIHLKEKGPYKIIKRLVTYGGNTVDESEKYMIDIIRTKTLKEYTNERNINKTNALLSDIDKLSLTELRQKYFIKEQK